MLPKAETANDLRRLDQLIAKAEAANGIVTGTVRVIAIVETCAGIAAAAELAAAGTRLCRIVFGAGDLGADLGLPTIRGDLSAALAYGRAKIVYDARAAGLPPPVDGPYLRVRDLAGFAQDCEIARALGHGGRLCLHPDQVPIVNRIFAPDPEETAFARKVITAFAEAESAGSASIVVDGVFVDYPIVNKARRIVALADVIAAREIGRSRAADRSHHMSAATGAAPARPLGGKRVLDCATFIAGPTCATLLGEFGAEVIKVELPGVGCPLRQFGTMTEIGMSLPWLSEARNKKSLTLDLRMPEGAAILKQLVEPIGRTGREFSAGHLGAMGARLGQPARDQSGAGNGAHFGLRTDRAVSGPPRFRSHRQCVWRTFLSGRLPRPPAGDAR